MQSGSALICLPWAFPPRGISGELRLTLSSAGGFGKKLFTLCHPEQNIIVPFPEGIQWDTRNNT